MNPFRSRKKSHDAGDQRPSIDANTPPVPSFASKTFKRGKKSLPEQKPQQIDIATALPSSDDFRTSLIMPNLSARFSMLREQDDPTSKIGKANDDSVLFPKRASRMNLFNRNELTDIAEVDSVRSSMRPPFAPWGTNSYGSFESYGTEDDGSRSGSVMSRSRPGEGNTLFGGRQKIYKITVGGTGSSKTTSANEDGSSSKGMGGKFLYGDDVSSSAFQKLREQEKEEREMAELGSKSPRSSKEHERPSSPSSVNYDPFRETTSSMTSAPSESRTSTAATSVASQRSMYGGHGNLNGSPPIMPLASQAPTNALNPDRPNHKSKRLYGQGLDQHIYDQQSSAMNRLESLHRQRVAGGPPVSNNLPESRSANNLNERFQRSGQLYASNECRATSPPPDVPPKLADFDLSLHEEQPLGTRSQLDSGYGRSPPISPPISPIQDPSLIASLEPNDVGKATASGAFNKPRKQYDEQQYLQRQLQLQQGRETPPSARSFSPTALSIEEKAAGRSRDGSFTSTQSRSGSFKTQQGPHLDDPAVTVVPGNPNPSIKDRQTNQDHATTWQSGVMGMSPGHVSAQPGSKTEAGRTPDLVLSRYQESSKVPMGQTKFDKPRDMDHPLYRTHHSASADSPSEPPRSNGSDTIASQDIAHPMKDPAIPQGFDADSPTLGPTPGLNGLNGLVRAHLRNDSGQSSIYPEQSPGLVSRFPIESPTDGVPLGDEQENRPSEKLFHKEAWDDYRDSSNQRMAGLGIAESNQAMPPALSLKARQIWDQANALRNHESSKVKQTLGVDKVHRLLGSEAPRTSQESSNSSSWQDHLKAHHARGGSTETEKERDSLANELAERRRMVRDNLRSFVENESRSASPVPRAQENSPSKQGAAFGILKSKGSRGSLASRHDQPSKAMKMLGMNHPNGSSRSGHDSFAADELDQSAHHARDDRKGSLGARAAPPGFQHPNYRQRDFHDRSQEDLSRRTSPSSKASRDRSNVGSPERRLNNSNERNNGDSYRTTQGADRFNGYHPDVPQYRKFSNGPRPAPELMESMPSHQIPPDPHSASRLRSNSRTNNPRGYFEQRDNLQTSSTHNLSLSPGTPYSPPSTSSSHEIASPSNMMPVMVTSPPPNTPRLTSRRKKSINKQDISDPTFLSSTSSVGTIDLPPGASLTNGMEPPHSAYPPPVPPFNPRRKRTQTLRQALGRTEKPEHLPSAPVPEDVHHERSNFSADDNEPVFKGRQRLRKTSSEGGNMNARARQQASMEPGPVVPAFPQMTMVVPSPTTSMVSHPHPGVHRSPNEMAASAVMPSPSIGAFPHPGLRRCPHGHDVPASAVMF